MDVFRDGRVGQSSSWLDELILDNKANRVENSYKISNAAGFLKDAEVDPRVMGLLGFDRVVIRTGEERGVDGYTLTNTTRNHDFKYITEILKEGGASGDAVWDSSVRAQKYFAERVGDDVKLIGCGGINSVERMNERFEIGNCDEVQFFTPLIFEGTGLLRKLRER